MLSILGSPKKLCDGLTRRELLRAGGLGLFGMGLNDFVRLRAAQAKSPLPSADRSFGRAKACILLYLYGSPSQLELCDLKPAAPLEIRGEFRPIRSRLPGCDVCEHLPRMAGVMDRVSVVRSMTHPYPIHGVAYALTGIGQTEIPLELNRNDPRHWPFIGSVLDYLAQHQGERRRAGAVPGNVALPWPISSRRTGGSGTLSGPFAAFLGSAYNPVWTEFQGRGIRGVNRVAFANALAYQGPDPYLGITPADRFAIGQHADWPSGITLDQLDRRRSLVEQLDRARRDLEQSPAGRALDWDRELAFSLIHSDKLRRALDLSREPAGLRDAYGMTLFGQGVLAARRLVEAGCRFATVIWDEYGAINTAWDTHIHHFQRLKNELLPALDRAFSALIRDLEARGLLEETLVLVLSEHGRTPRVQNVPGGGRDHWSRAYTNLFAGGGIARGRVVGKSDKVGGAVVDRPVSPKDVLATAYHLLGIDPKTTLSDRLGRPVPLVANGEVIGELLA